MKFVMWHIAFAAMLLFVTSRPSTAEPLLFGGIGFGSNVNRGALIAVDATTGAGTLLGPGVGPNAGLTGLALSASGALYGTSISNPVLVPGTGGPALVRLDPATGALLSAAPLTWGMNPLEVNDLAADLATNTLYGVSLSTTDFVSSLYTINPASGVATLRGSTGVIGVTIAFAPNGTLYMTSATFDQGGTQTGSFLHTVNPATGALFSTVAIAPLPSGNLVHIGGLAIDAAGSIFASGREANVSQQGDIYVLTPTGSVTLLGSTGVGEVGDLAIAVPEPATILLFSAALGVMAMRRRFRR